MEGAFERAHRGTLLLDEISEMRLDLQAKLLRVLQEQEFERVGGTVPIHVDARVVATTNRDLSAEVREGKFREDLFYRLSVMPIVVPPLRDRPEDIPILAQQFAIRAAKEMGKRITGFEPAALARLQTHSWPGNVRELAHAIERAIILSAGPTIHADAFDLGLMARAPRAAAAADPNGAAHFATLNIAEAEQALIQRALEATGNNRTRAAELLGISVRTLRNKLNRPDEEEE